jgi:MFS family permease
VPLVHESRAPGDTKYDIPGVLLATGGLFALVYGFTEAAKAKNPNNPHDLTVQGWGAPTTITFLAIAVVLLVGFVLWERRSRNPLLPLRVVLDRNRGGSFLTYLFVAAGLYGMFLFLTYYFQVNLGYTPLHAGFAFLPFSLGIIFTAGVVAQLLPRVGPRPLMITGLVLAVLGMAWLTQISLTTSYWTHVFPAEVIMSIGLACVFIPAASTSLIGVDSHDAGVASATLNTSQQIGGSLGTALLNTVFAGAVTAYVTAHVTSPRDVPRVLPHGLIHGYHVSFVWAAALFAAALVGTVILVTAGKQELPSDTTPAPDDEVEADVPRQRTGSLDTPAVTETRE